MLYKKRLVINSSSPTLFILTQKCQYNLEPHCIKRKNQSRTLDINLFLSPVGRKHESNYRKPAPPIFVFILQL